MRIHDLRELSDLQLEEELTKVAETVMEHQLMADLYRKHVNMIKTALGRGG